MAVNPMQRKTRISFLIGVLITLLVTGVVIVLLFLKVNSLQKDIDAEQAKKRKIYVLNQDVKSGQAITEDMFIDNYYIIIKRGKKNYYVGRKQ